ncbi:MAG: putative transposase [Desulfurivibrionaceae bacterium]
MQVILPYVSPGATQINEIISVVSKDDKWFYFVGNYPVFQHTVDDLPSFRMFTSQLYCQGQCKQVDIAKTFGIPKISVKRAVQKYREGGIKAFYAPRKGRGPTVITPEVIEDAERLFAAGWSRTDVAEHLDVKYNTLSKAIGDGRVREITGDPQDSEYGTDFDRELSRTEKTERDIEDAEAKMGTACTRPVERALAAVGALGGASTCFENCRGVDFGGVLCALPALVANGLLGHLESCFEKLDGYYQRLHIFLLLSYMALCRIKCIEQLRFEPPGELGKLMGLDRVPEVRCLRKKIARICENGEVKEWHALLSRQWMEQKPDLTGVLYVDGHVRPYHGGQTKLPRRYVARQKLCLRGTTDYWVNDASGRPFFVVSKPVDDGLLRTLRNQIVPRLLEDVPGQPSETQLEEDPHLSRFLIVFDREGYSPGFFKEMWQTHRICCITYHKYPKGKWPEEEFGETEVRMPGGQTVSMELAERGSRIGSGADSLWVDEVRKMTKSGHQTSVISPGQANLKPEDCKWLFSRWSQENFFRYMMQEFAIDALSEYGTDELHDTQRVINPRWRELNSQCRSMRGRLDKAKHKFGCLHVDEKLKQRDYEDWKQRKADLKEDIDHLGNELEKLKAKRKEESKHITIGELSEEDRFQQLAPTRKLLMDTIKMIAYRSETGMAEGLKQYLGKESDARRLLKDLYRSQADLLPDLDEKVLHVQIHHLANPRSNRAIKRFFEDLNKTEMRYPGTKFRLRFSFAGSTDPPK